jgi:ABC-type transporter Mla subunit MlaD
VKYRGVLVGNVESIGFVEEKYHTMKRYVQVMVNFYPPVSGRVRKDNFDDRLRILIGEGLRVRLASQSLTGTMYLEVDYRDIRANPVLPIDWTPKTYYVPSVPSTATRLTESAETVVRQLADANLGQVVNEIRGLLAELTRIVKEDVGPTLKNINAAAEELPGTVREIKSLVNGPTTRDLGELVAALKTGVQRDALPLLENLRAASRDLPGTLGTLGHALRRVDSLVTAQEQNLEDIVENLRTITEQVQGWSAQAEKFPARLLFGEPPPRTKLGER